MRVQIGISTQVVAVSSLILTVLAIPVTAADCQDWYTEEYFKIATVEDVADCIQSGWNLKAFDVFRNGPLHFAAMSAKSPGVITALIDAGADVTKKGKRGNTPLHYAARYNENPAIIALLQPVKRHTNRRCSVHPKENWDDRTAIELAVRYNKNVDVTAALLAACPEYNTSPRRWESYIKLLHPAARYNENPAIIDLLVAAGADIDSHSRWVWGIGEALELAVRYNKNADVTAALLAALPDHRRRVRLAAATRLLHLAARFSENSAIIDLLLAAGADINGRRWNNGPTPLHSAARYNKNSAVIGVLLNAGADAHLTVLDYTAGTRTTIWDYDNFREATRNLPGYLRFELEVAGVFRRVIEALKPAPRRGPSQPTWYTRPSPQHESAMEGYWRAQRRASERYLRMSDR